jgi:hypothetical protein
MVTWFIGSIPQLTKSVWSRGNRTKVRESMHEHFKDGYGLAKKAGESAGTGACAR